MKRGSQRTDEAVVGRAPLDGRFVSEADLPTPSLRSTCEGAVVIDVGCLKSRLLRGCGFAAPSGTTSYICGRLGRAKLMWAKMVFA